ncbi:MAG: hypothetical protein Q9200_007665 [Gallowayella weberi]
MTLIGTKGEPEVRAYVQALQAASTKQHMYGDRRSLVGAADIPAAAEISQECCNSLEQAADALATLQQKHEEHFQKQKHADLWKLDQGKARWVEQRLRESEEGEAEVCEKVPAAEVLKLNELIKLSQNIFMNGGNIDSNWRSFCTKNESPAILHTAFSDLHSVVMSITRRLVQSSLFFAMSRLRAAKSSTYTPQPAVKHCDVLAALKILGMKENSRDTWAHVARRCGLEVYDHAYESHSRRKMEYGEVERILTGGEITIGENPFPTRDNENRSLDHDSTEDASSDHDSASSAGISRISHHSSVRSSPTADRSKPADKLGMKIDAYLNYIDQKASREEEIRLWNLLGKNPPPNVLSGEATQMENTGPYRHGRDDLDDWRAWTNHRPEWEACDVEDLEEHLADTRKQAQGVLSKAGTARTGKSRSSDSGPQSSEQEPSDQGSANDRDAGATHVESSANDSSSEHEADRDEMEI